MSPPVTKLDEATAPEWGLLLFCVFCCVLVEVGLYARKRRHDIRNKVGEQDFIYGNLSNVVTVEAIAVIDDHQYGSNNNRETEASFNDASSGS